MNSADAAQAGSRQQLEVKSLPPIQIKGLVVSLVTISLAGLASILTFGGAYLTISLNALEANLSAKITDAVTPLNKKHSNVTKALTFIVNKVGDHSPDVFSETDRRLIDDLLTPEEVTNALGFIGTQDFFSFVRALPESDPSKSERIADLLDADHVELGSLARLIWADGKRRANFTFVQGVEPSLNLEELDFRDEQCETKTYNPPDHPGLSVKFCTRHLRAGQPLEIIVTRSASAG